MLRRVLTFGDIRLTASLETSSRGAGMGRAFDSDSAENLRSSFRNFTIALLPQMASPCQGSPALMRRLEVHPSQPAPIGKSVIGHLLYSNGTFLAL
jgi:hypothetical protein